MKRNAVLKISVFLLLVLMLAGCASTKADPNPTPVVCPTSIPPSCPTKVPLSCPTAPVCPTTVALQFSSGENYWSAQLANVSAFDVTFDPGDKCAVSAPSLLGKGMNYYHIKVNDQAHATYAVIFQTLDEGKTLQDLQAYSNTASEPPGWAHDFQEIYVSTGNNSYYAEDLPVGQVYISCFVSTENGPLRILDYGPVEVK